MKVIKLSLVLCILIAGLCGCKSKETLIVDANVLTINSEILEGKLVGQFLGSSGGWLKSDVIKVGVKFEINGNLFLEDLELSHAQLAYYKDKDVLPLKIIIRAGLEYTGLEIRLCGYFVKKRRLDCGFAKQLIDYTRRQNN